MLRTVSWSWCYPPHNDSSKIPAQPPRSIESHRHCWTVEVDTLHTGLWTETESWDAWGLHCDLQPAACWLCCDLATATGSRRYENWLRSWDSQTLPWSVLCIPRSWRSSGCILGCVKEPPDLILYTWSCSLRSMCGIKSTNYTGSRGSVARCRSRPPMLPS